MKYRFNIVRTELRSGVLDVEADSFEQAATIAAQLDEGRVPRRAVLMTTFTEDREPEISFEIQSGRELRR